MEMNLKAKCESLGIPAAINAEFQTGRMVRIIHYPVTNYRPHRVFAVWRDFDGKTIRRRLQDIESRFSEASENYAIQAAGKYLEWLSDNRANCLGNEFRGRRRMPGIGGVHLHSGSHHYDMVLLKCAVS